MSFYLTPDVPKGYECRACGASGCKLWRQYNTFANHIRLLCATCAARDEEVVLVVDAAGRHLSKYGNTDQIGSLIPAVPDEANETFWVYSSVPATGFAWWQSLPSYPPIPEGSAETGAEEAEEAAQEGQGEDVIDNLPALPDGWRFVAHLDDVPPMQRSAITSDLVAVIPLMSPEQRRVIAEACVASSSGIAQMLGRVEIERDELRAEVSAWRAAYDNVDFGPQTPEEVPVFLRERDKVNGEQASVKVASLERECVMLRVENAELKELEQVEYTRFWRSVARRWNDWAAQYASDTEAEVLGHAGRRAAIDELIRKLRSDLSRDLDAMLEQHEAPKD